MLAYLLVALAAIAVTLGVVYFLVPAGRRLINRNASTMAAEIGQIRSSMGMPTHGRVTRGSRRHGAQGGVTYDDNGNVINWFYDESEPDDDAQIVYATRPADGAGSGNAALAIAVGSVATEGEKEAGKPPFPPREEKKMPAGIPLEEVLADTKPGLPPTDAEKKEGTLTKLKRRVSRKKTPADAAAIADAKPTATEESKKEPAEAETDEA